MSIKPVSFSYVPTYQGDEGLVIQFPVTASQTFLKGDLVTLTSKALVIMPTPAANPSVLLGIALQDAQTVATPGTAALTRTYCPVQVIRPTDLYIGAYASGSTFAATDVTVAHEVVKTAAGNWQVAAATTNLSLTIVGSAEYGAVSKLSSTTEGPITEFSSGGALYVKFITAACQWTTTTFA